MDVTKRQVLVTGANGFLGSAVVKELQSQNLKVIASIRKLQPKDSLSDYVQIGEINGDTDWSNALESIDTVVHCAARVHVMNDSADALEAFREVNVSGTLKLARSAVTAGVRRFIYISSVKVNGEATYSGDRFSYSDAPAPQDAYGLSKMEAESGLWDIARKTGLEVTIVRPPLVYGPGVKANFASLMKLANKNLPLPFGAIHNKRSMVALENLVSLIVVCISNPKAAGQTFLVSDDQDISTTQLLELMIRAVGKKPRLLPVPVSWLIFFATLLRKKSIADRLCGSLQVDINHTKMTLGWVPPVSVEQGIRRCFQ